MMGWATMIPEFQQLGLYLSGMGYPKMKESEVEGFAAAQELFDISYEHALYLFNSHQTDINGEDIEDDEGNDEIDRKDTPLKAAARIRKYVEGIYD